MDSEADIEVMKSVAKEWEIRTGLELEWETFTKIYQKDVNNYIIIDKNGKYKSKGSYVKKLSKTDYDLPIVNKALIEYFVNNTPVEDTINKCDDLIEFQKTVKVSSLYSHALHGETKIKEKVIRVFASSDSTASGVFKVKGESKIEKIGNTPEHCFINNENIIGVKITDELDKNYYIELAKKRVDDFLSVKNKSKSTSISSGIKFVNFHAKETLEQIYSENEFDSFVDFMIYVTENTNVDKRSIETLIKLNYFSSYGGNITLFNIFTEFKSRYKKAYVETTKQKRILELYEYEKNVPEEAMSVKEQLLYETEVLGSPSCIYDVPKGVGYVTEINTNYSPKATLYGLSNGNTIEMKIDKRAYKASPVNVGDIIQITSFDKKQRCVKVDDEWKPLEGKFDFWIKAYKVLKVENLPIDSTFKK